MVPWNPSGRIWLSERQNLGNESFSSVKVGEIFPTSSRDDSARAKGACLLLAFPSPPNEQHKEELTAPPAQGSCALLPSVEPGTKVTQKDILRSLALWPASPALALFLRPAGQQLRAGGVLSRVPARFCSLFINRGARNSFPFHTVTLAPFSSTVPSPCLTWIPGSLCDFLSGAQQVWVFSPLCTSVPFLDHRNVYPVFQAQLCLLSALKIFINVMWIEGRGETELPRNLT